MKGSKVQLVVMINQPRPTRLTLSEAIVRMTVSSGVPRSSVMIEN